ncbi:MAG: tetratricopeptide repeat protein [Chlamydiae bacterium]|nr:tetratricopeptide repeat protein [Chlamydiota bacterium]
MQLVKEEWASFDFWVSLDTEHEIKISLENGLKQIHQLPHQKQGYHYAARGYFLLGSLQDALATYEAALQQFPLDPFFMQGIGAIFFHLSNLKEAKNWLEKSWELDPKISLSLFYLGAIEMEIGKLEKACEYFHQTIDLDPFFPIAYRHLGTCYKKKGDFHLAEKYLFQAHTQSPSSGHFSLDLAILYQEYKGAESAIVWYDLALKCLPDRFDIFYARANCLFDAARYEDAIREFSFLIEAMPQNPLFLHCLAMCYFALTKWQESIKYFDAVLSIEPNYLESLLHKSQALKNTGQVEQALLCLYKAEANHKSYDIQLKKSAFLNELEKYTEAAIASQEAIALSPDKPYAYNNLSVALKGLGEYQKALTSGLEALKKDPNFFEALLNCVGIYIDLENFVQAKLLLDKLLSIRPHCVTVLSQLGHYFFRKEEYTQAENIFSLAIKEDPNFAGSYSNRGLTYHALLDLEKAKQDLHTALTIHPQHREASWNLCLALLAQGDFERGLPLYERRFEKKEMQFTQRLDIAPRLSTYEVMGKKILITYEQGLGDAIQMARYVLKLIQMGAFVTLEVPFSLKKLMKTLHKDLCVVEEIPKGSTFDYQIPIMSLPYYFNIQIDQLPGLYSYLFYCPRRNQYWKDKVSKKMPKVGLVISGNEKNQTDKRRSVPLKYLEPIFHLPIEYHLLQKEIRQQDRQSLANYPNLVTHDHELTDMIDTASLMVEMDLVVSVDTSVAHLAGAIGKPVWILLPHYPDYRWLLNREDSPWYPSARLFRQNTYTQWESVIQHIQYELQKLFQE